MSIRIMIADRQEMFREVLRPLLESEPDFTVVGESGDSEQCLKLATTLKPDVLLCDLHLPRRSGTHLLRQIAALEVKMCPILLTDEIDKSEVVEALRWGVRGIVSKQEPSNLLFKSIRAVMAGEYWISHGKICELVQNLRTLTIKIEQGSPSGENRLSQQQQQIVDAIATGCSNKEIAKELSISERTVKYHLTRIFAKLGVTGRTQLARFALKENTRDKAS
jgi:DNA-binding NarL/FixJ family response regulator